MVRRKIAIKQFIRLFTNQYQNQLVQSEMQSNVQLKRSSRPNFRSFKYSVFNPAPSKHIPQDKEEAAKQRSNSIINIKKLRSFSTYKHLDVQEKFTIDTTAKKDPYMQTFMTFMSQNPTKQLENNKQNEESIVIMPRYHSFFNQDQSQFTLLDVIAKPIRYIDTTINAANKELKSQQKNIELLRYELVNLRNIINRTLTDLQEQTYAKIATFKRAVQDNQVLENERKLRSRKQLRLLERTQTSNAYLVSLICERGAEVERNIFNCQPFSFPALPLLLQMQQPQQK